MLGSGPRRHRGGEGGVDMSTEPDDQIIVRPADRSITIAGVRIEQGKAMRYGVVPVEDDQ